MSPQFCEVPPIEGRFEEPLPIQVQTGNRGTLRKVLKNMDKDRIKGKAKEMEGRVEQAAGDLTGSDRARADGAAKKTEGKIQNTFGKVKDKVRDALD